MNGDVRKHMKLLTRIGLFLVVFILTIIFEIVLTNYQSQYVLEPISRRTGNIQSISQFINSVERSINSLKNFRWEYGDSSALIEILKKENAQQNRHFDAIEKDYTTIGGEQYLLVNATETTLDAFLSSTNILISLLESNDIKEASSLFYGKLSTYSVYLTKYSQELLKQAILDNQESYNKIITLNNELKKIQIFNMSLCLTFGILLISAITKLLKFIKLMSLESQEISKGNFTREDIDETRNDEIGYMAKAFNEMKHSMRAQVTLLEEKRKVEGELYKKENEALGLQNLLEREKLQQLRSQINPHFLFNTLNIIKITSNDEKAYKTEKLLNSLSKLYRFALANNDSQVFLSNEIQIVKEFYALYKARFGDRISLVWEISKEIDLTETIVPSFFLQPIVENAFNHGLGHKETNGKIIIRIKVENQTLISSIEDDGVGMNRETLENLKQNLKNPPTTGSHIGLYNIAARIKFLGPNCGLDVESQEGKGSKVTLCFPYITNSEAIED